MGCGCGQNKGMVGRKVRQAAPTLSKPAPVKLPSIVRPQVPPSPPSLVANHVPKLAPRDDSTECPNCKVKLVRSILFSDGVKKDVLRCTSCNFIKQL